MLELIPNRTGGKPAKEEINKNAEPEDQEQEQEQEEEEVNEGEAQQEEPQDQEGEGDKNNEDPQYQNNEGNDAEGAAQEENEDDPDGRSVYVKNVDYSADPTLIKEHFQECGSINRVTIICNKVTGHPLGYAYIEFENKDGVEKAIELMNDSLFKGRLISVMRKRKNVPGKGRGGFRGGFPRYRGPFYGRRPFYRGYRPY